MKMSVKKLSFLAMLIAMASAVHYLEGLLPPILPSVPGTKIGLANIFSLFALCAMGVGEGFTVMVVRCFVGTLLGGSVTGLIYAISGGTLSCTIMAVLLKVFHHKLSLYGVSTAGAFLHNLGQMLAACLVMGNGYVFYYFPYLALISIPAGLLTGLCTDFCIKSLKRGGFLLK
ncbi:MAG: Gx transporter family protein [Clostridiales bacterium]|nr:Gx transporter family protein [Clostridiales bacterium]